MILQKIGFHLLKKPMHCKLTGLTDWFWLNFLNTSKLANILVLGQNFQTAHEQHAMTYWLFGSFFYLIFTEYKWVKSWLAFSSEITQDVFEWGWQRMFLMIYFLLKHYNGKNLRDWFSEKISSPKMLTKASPHYAKNGILVI